MMWWRDPRVKSINGQSPVSDDEPDDMFGDEYEPVEPDLCAVCDADTAMFWLEFGPPPHARDLTFPQRLAVCARCESFVRTTDTEQLAAAMYANTGEWAQDLAHVRPVAEAFIEHSAGSTPMSR